MKKVLLTLLFATIMVYARAVQVSGTLTIDATQAASTTNFKDFNSAITYLTSSNARTDNGPANAAPFGISGAVIIDVVAGTGPYVEQVDLKNIPGASAINTITINGNGNTLQDTCTSALRAVLRFNNGDYYRVNGLTIKPIVDVTYGWGIHFYTGSDYNIVENCTIDISVVTSTTVANSAGIVFSNSTTSVTTAGANGYYNIIQNNTIKGNPTGGGLGYGIVGLPASSSATISANRILNNTIEDFYSYGIYWGNSNRTMISGNIIRRPLKTTMTTTYGIAMNGGSLLDTIANNKITNLYDGATTNTGTCYGIYLINYSGTVASPNTIYNNLVKINNGDGPQNGIYSLTSFNVKLFNNTISIENAASTSATNATIGFYFSGATSATSALEMRNNIFSITRTGAGPKTALSFVNSIAVGATISKNAYYSNNAAYTMGSHNGFTYTNYTQWKTALTPVDTTSNDAPPQFVSPSTNDYAPQDAWYNGNGDPVANILTDINGVTRTLPLDIGAYEAVTTAGTDVAIGNLTMPVTPYAAGSQNISATIRNAATTAITSATLNWSINGVPQTPVAFSGNLASGAYSSPIALGAITVAAGIMYNIEVTVVDPNGLPDGFAGNNTATNRTACLLPGGTYTVNAAGTTGGTNFTSLGYFANVINVGGMTGAMTLDFVPGSGPYTEQIFFIQPVGLSAVNNITVNGNGERIEFNNTNSASIGIINLIGTDYMTFTNLGVRSLNVSYGVGYLLTGGADSNVIQNCYIDISSVTGGSGSAGIAVTSALNSPTSAATNVGRFNRFDNNTITGNATGGPYYGIAVSCNTATNSTNNGYLIRNNVIRDFTAYGMYLYGTMGSIIKGNTILRPTKSSPTTCYGIYGANAMAQDTIENNIITQPFEAAQTNANSFFGIYFNSTNVPVARPVIIKNNLIHNIKSYGPAYGIYLTTAPNFKVLHNTVSIDHPAAVTTSATACFYNSGTPTTQTIRNNIFYMNRGGTGTKHLIYLNTTSATGYVINNNALHYKIAPSATGNNTGYYNATNYVDLTAWKTANTNAFDQNSKDADPLFRTQNVNAPFTPGNDTLNNIGGNLTVDVPRDFLGTLRTTTPDPGSYEFSTYSNDAGITRFASPLNPISFGTHNIDVVLKNSGTGSLGSASIDWSVDNVTQNNFPWLGGMNSGDSTTLTIGTYNFATSGFYNLKAWSSLPNGVTDSLTYNDTTSFTFCTPINGTLTINSALPASSTNYTSFNSLINVLKYCGINGNVTVNVASGVYTEQVVISNIPGLTGGNRIEFVGQDSANTRLTFLPTNTNLRYTLMITGADNITFRNIRFESQGTTFGCAVQIFGDASNRSDSLVFQKCTFATIPYTGTAMYPFSVSSSLTSATTVTYQNATALIVDSCNVLGGYYGLAVASVTTTRATDIRISNCYFTGTYLYTTYINGAENVVIHNNRYESIGRALNYATPYGIYCINNGPGIIINANILTGALGGYGIYLGTTIGNVSSRHVISNNMIQLGELSNTTNGIYLVSVANAVVAHNSVNVTSASATASCFYMSSTAGATYNTVDVINNIFRNALQGYVLYLNDGGGSVTPNILQPVNWKIDNNCYYGLGAYPYRSNNFISTTLAGYRTATTLPIDSYTVVMDPMFISTAAPVNLRVNAIALNNIGRTNTWVTTDIDGATRGTLPDPGINEFTPPADDAGVIGFVLPKAPQDTGLTDVRVLIKNFGAANLTSANVTYVEGANTHTVTYTGNITPSGIDTVTFNATSGPGATSQQYHYSGATLQFTAYTSQPNSAPDADAQNDTLRSTVCRGLSGIFTINPLGSGNNNFTSFAAAVDALICGGVLGPVVFEVANGTYTEQLNIGIIPGASALNNVTFRSASLNRNNVTLTFAPSTAPLNYTVNFAGTRFVNFEHMTISNTSATFGRVISLGLGGTSYAGNISVRNAALVGPVVASTSDVHTLVYSAGGSHVQNITLSNNNLLNGSSAVWMGGQNVVNNYSTGLVVDSNIISNFYYTSLYLNARSNSKIRNNIITPQSTATTYGLYFTGVSGATEVANNKINMLSGYGMYISGLNQYGEILSASIYNNAVTVASNATAGIFFTTSSNFKAYNNSVSLNTASVSTTAAGIYYSGSVAAAPSVNATQAYFFNNAISSATLPAFGVGNATGMSSIVTCNHNVYYGTGAVLVYLNGVSHTTAAFNNVKGAINGTNDHNSYAADPGFTSVTNVVPLVSNNASWVLNGRGIHEFGLSSDIIGNIRSQAVVTGTPDIGAYEFTPSVLPAPATVTGTLNYGETQHFLVFGDTVGTITWGFGGTLPTSISAFFAPGTLISNRNSSPNSNALIDTAAHLMDAYWGLTQTGGSNFNYDLRLRYNTFQMGNIPSESDIKLANRMVDQFTSNSWWNNTSTSTVLDTVNNIFGMNTIFDFTYFTGTTDISSPLPVKLNMLRAEKSGNDAVVLWSTAQERNASHFEVERSYTRNGFVKAGSVRAAGNSSVTTRYRFADENIGLSSRNQTVYYRLKMIDADGTFEYSDIVSVSFDDRRQFNVSIYPNPFSSEMNLNITSETEGKAVITVTDLFGRTVNIYKYELVQGENLVKLDGANELAQGVYFIKTAVNGSETVTKVIKE